MSGSPAASSSVTIAQVRASAPAPPASSESARTRRPSFDAASSRSVNSGRSNASRRAGASATGLISRVTKSRTVSRISSCSGERRRSNTLLSLDAEGLDDGTPLVELGANVFREVVGVAVRRDDLLLAEDSQHGRVLEEAGGLAAHARDDLGRGFQRREDADPGGELEAGHALRDPRHPAHPPATLRPPPPPPPPL